MNIKSICCAFLCLTSVSSEASNFFKLSNQPLSTLICEMVNTDKNLDLALTNDGYFILSLGEKNKEQVFTRYGQLLLDSHAHLVNRNGYHLLGINKKSDPNSLQKIKIKPHTMPPHASKRVRVILNLPSNATDTSVYTTTTKIYDSISKQYDLTIKYQKMGSNTWSLQAIVDERNVNQGTLTFESSGALSKQEGLSEILWRTHSGISYLNIDHSETTTTATDFNIRLIDSDGYPKGTLIGVGFDMLGDVVLYFNNGKTMLSKSTVAVAKFLNPKFLERVGEAIYKPTERSGPPRVHKSNSEGSIVSGYLEPDPCPTINS